MPALDGDIEEDEVTADTAKGKYSLQVFQHWRDVLATAVAAEKATRLFPVCECPPVL